MWNESNFEIGFSIVIASKAAACFWFVVQTSQRIDSVQPTCFFLSLFRSYFTHCLFEERLYLNNEEKGVLNKF